MQNPHCEHTGEETKQIKSNTPVIYFRSIMLRSIAFNTLRTAASSTPGAARAGTNSSRAPAMLKAASIARYNNNAITHADHRRYMSGGSLYAVDAPNGDHDLQDIVREFLIFSEHLYAFCLTKEDNCAQNLS